MMAESDTMAYPALCCLSIVNEGAAINEPSVVSLRKGALLNVVWAGKELFKDLGAGVN
jgi:hypothetical protein